MSEDFVLSEIHAEKEGCKSQLLFESKDFELNGHLITECSVFNVLHDTGVYHDEDGDLKVVRKPKGVPVSGNTQENVWRIKINHQMVTPLNYVGLQLWAGSLLMADYLLSHPETVRGKKVLEIGCGVGFISIIHSRISGVHEILCTDYLPCVLKLAEHNYQGNLHGVCKAKFEQFDLTDSSDKFQSKLKQLNFEPDIVLAGDVTYSPELTEAFVMHLKWLLKPGKRAILSLKKRMVFHVLPMNSDESESHVYDAHFVHFLNCLKENKQLRVSYIFVDDVKQRILGYRRESNMVLLEIHRVN
jgi:predicted nicotinamide N-methyase